MKILIVNKFLHPNGGSETYIFKLGEQLKALGNEVQYFGMEHENRIVGNNAEQYTSNMDFHGGSKLKKLTYPLKTIYSTEAKNKIKVVLDDFQPDVIHINNFNYQLTPSILYAIKDYKKKIGKKITTVYTAHDFQLLCPNHMLFDTNETLCEKCIGGDFINCTKNNCIHSSKAKSLIGTIEATLYNKLEIYDEIDKIVCCSEFMKNKMDTNPLFKSKTIAMHNFIDNISYEETEKEDYVLYFGRFDKEKGIETIINASDIDFVCAGSGQYDDELSHQKHIKNIGFKSGDELKELIGKAKCSVYPSIWYENCPFSVMESIMLGTPVVGAKIGGIPELIDDGVTGYLFEANNVDDFKDKINKIINDKDNANKMKDACFNKRFSTAEEYCKELIENIYQ